MTSTKPLTAAERARRLKIKGLIREARISAMVCSRASMPTVAQQLDDLADVAEKYMEGLK